MDVTFLKIAETKIVISEIISWYRLEAYESTAVACSLITVGKIYITSKYKIQKKSHGSNMAYIDPNFKLNSWRPNAVKNSNQFEMKICKCLKASDRSNTCED